MIRSPLRKVTTLALGVALAVGSQIALVPQAHAANTAPTAPIGLLTNDLEHPMAIDGAPFFSWLPQDVDRDEVQSAYQIVLKDAVDSATVWDSGKVSSDAQTYVVYSGPTLAEGHPYKWTVKTWDGAGDESPESAPAEFATAIGNANWAGKWLRGPTPSTAVTVTTAQATQVDGGGLTMANGASGWTDYTVTADVKVLSGSGGLAFRASGGNAYVWQIKPGTGLVKNTLSGSTLTPIGTVPFTIYPDSTYTLKVILTGTTIDTYIDSALVDSITDSTYASGGVGFYQPSGTKADFAGMTVVPAASTGAQLQVTGNTTRPNALYSGGYAWTDYTIESDVIITAASGGFMLRASNDFMTGYWWQLSVASNGLVRYKVDGGVATQIGNPIAIGKTVALNRSFHVKIMVSSTSIATWVDGVMVDSYNDATDFATGTFGYRQISSNTARFANTVVTDSTSTVVYDAQSSAPVTGDFDRASTTQPALAVQNTAAASTYTIYHGDTGDFTSGAPLSVVDASSWLYDNAGGTQIFPGTEGLTNFTLTTRVRIATNTRNAGILLRAQDTSNSYVWQLRTGSTGTAGVRSLKMVNGDMWGSDTSTWAYPNFGQVNHTVTLSQVYRLRLVVNGDTVTTYLDDELISTVQDLSDVFTSGGVGLRLSGSSEQAYFQEFSVLDSSTGAVLYSNDWSNLDVFAGWTAKPTNAYWYYRDELPLTPGKTVAKAIAYVAGINEYDVNVNGTRVGRGNTYDYAGDTPAGYTVSDTRYEGWDITEALGSDSTLALGIWLKTYRGGQGRAGGTQGLLVNAKVFYTDGSVDVLNTDETTWKVTMNTPERPYTTLRNGEGDLVEQYDARLEIPGWNEVGFNDSAWTTPQTLGTHPTTTLTRLVAQEGHVSEKIVHPVSVTTLPDNATIVDWGVIQPIRPVVKFSSGSSATPQLTLMSGYGLTSTGHVSTTLSASWSQNTNMSYLYHPADGARTYQAWDHLGQRYFEIPAAAYGMGSGPGGSFTVDDIWGISVTGEVPEGRELEWDSSDAMLDLVVAMMKRSVIGSLQNQFVDTPTREKGQFLGDAINISQATTTAFYERAWTRKAINQFLDSADRFFTSATEKGIYNAVYPNTDGKRDIPDYSVNMIYYVWEYYRMTGDLATVQRAYPYLQNTADWISRYIRGTATTQEANVEGLVANLTGYTVSSSYSFGIVDWPEPGRFSYDMISTSATNLGARTPINALCVRAFDSLAKLAEVMGDSTGKADYEGRSAALTTVMNNRLLTTDPVSGATVYSDGQYGTDGHLSTHLGQISTSFPLAFGIAPDDKVEEMVNYIADMGMRQGPMTADILLSALFDNGRPDAALELLTNVNDWGWAQLIDQYDATFTWEMWQFPTGDQSMSHGWGGAALYEIIRHFLGVQETDIAAKSLRIDPDRDLLDSLSGKVWTAKGPVSVDYSGSGENYVLKVTLPTNTSADIALPEIDQTKGRFLERSGYHLTNTWVDGEQVVHVGSGSYEFYYAAWPDTTDLQVAADAATALTPSLDAYTPATAAAVTQALAEANAVLADTSDLTQADIDAAKAKLMTALTGLVKKPAPAVEKAALQAAIAIADAKKSADYSAGFPALTTALAAAKTVNANPSATQAQVDKATADLIKAINALKPKVTVKTDVPGKQIVATKVKFGQAGVTLVKGKTFTLKPGVYYTKGSPDYVNGATYKSSNTKVATVDKKTGKVKALKPGKAKITATTKLKNAGGKTLSTSYTVTVVKSKPKAKVTKITVSNMPKTMKVGQTVWVTAKYSKANTPGVKVSYSSKESGIVAIDAAGRVQALKKGTDVITVKVGGKSKKFTIKVSK
jgi:alpha-L-rhamnosidase